MKNKYTVLTLGIAIIVSAFLEFTAVAQNAPFVHVFGAPAPRIPITWRYDVYFQRDRCPVYPHPCTTAKWMQFGGSGGWTWDGIEPIYGKRTMGGNGSYGIMTMYANCHDVDTTWLTAVAKAVQVYGTNETVHTSVYLWMAPHEDFGDWRLNCTNGTIQVINLVP